MGYRDKFDRSSKALAGIQDDVAEAVGETIDNVRGETIIRESGFPDRKDYELTTAGYLEYLRDCHELARDEYSRAVYELEEASRMLEGESYPSIGSQGRDGREQRQNEREAVKEVNEAKETVEKWITLLDRIEDAYNDA